MILSMATPENPNLIVELLKDFREQSNQHYEDLRRRLDYIEKHGERIESRLDHFEKKLDAVYDDREKVRITFGWQWAMVSLIIAVAAAGMTRMLFV